jgi:hypothetical protein
VLVRVCVGHRRLRQGLTVADTGHGRSG